MTNRSVVRRRIAGTAIACALLFGAPASYADEPAGEEGAAAVPAAPTPAEIELGRRLFDGVARLQSGGPSCNSCHHVQNEAVVGGGKLAKELTRVYSRRGAKRVLAVLPHDGQASSSPVMRAAYKDKEFTENEMRALAGFLQDADKQSADQKPAADYATRIWTTAAAGLVVMLAVIGAIGRGRKKRSVNSAIYDRQIASEGTR